MADTLTVYQDKHVYRICWMLDSGTEQGATLGEGGDEELETGDDDPEYQLSLKAAKQTQGVQRDFDGYFWETKKDASDALKFIKKVLKNPSQDDWPEWAKTALAAGWQPPKNWRF